MKSSGIVRRLDELGRIVLPKELRKTLNLNNRDSVEIYTKDSMIILKKYEPSCVFCESAENIVNFNGRNICKNCIKKLNIIAGLDSDHTNHKGI